MRVGLGYDVHRLVKGRDLILGGIKVPFDRGLKGYSDADVLLHAVIDALLGAVSKGDIGKHFPVGDPRFKDISSLVLLKTAGKILKKGRIRINNIDTVIIAEKPRLSSFTGRMEKKIASCLKIAASKVCVKAKTAEGLGDTGKGRAIEAFAVCLVDTVK
ncbi:MAG: 2-C-methyl-D-erythritol 2,4-cyclodiphosphate synthase [Candidatus Margulisiibacteriota bacterium]